MSNLLNIKDQNGNWIPIPVITNGIQSITQNQDYTLTITLNDGTTYTTTSIKGEDGQDYILTENDKQEIAQDVAELVDIPVDDVQINGTSIMQDGIANIPIASTSTLGAVTCAQDYGITVLSNGRLQTTSPSDAQLKSGSSNYRVITPTNQHKSVFYGLAKASGDTTQSESDNAVGTYTDEAKASIQSMLGVPSEDEVVTDVQIDGTSIVTDGVANIPIADARNKAGLFYTKDTSFYFNNQGYVSIERPSDNYIKWGEDKARVPFISQQHLTTFYGLAKAAGADEKNSTLPVGQYTESAKSAISSMLNAPESVSGMTPTITAKAGVRYICGECTTLDITTPESGIVDITFTSGTTPTVLTVTPPTGMTMMWANGFDSTALKANTVYEINIMDGCKGVACSWT